MTLIDTLKRYKDEIEADVLAITKISLEAMAATAKRSTIWASAVEVEACLIFPTAPELCPPSSLPTSPDEEESVEFGAGRSRSRGESVDEGSGRRLRGSRGESAEEFILDNKGGLGVSRKCLYLVMISRDRL